MEGAAETLLRTGKTIDETNKYLENTVYLSKLGFQDMDTSASQLVTIGNTYEYTADEMSAVVDKFAKLDSSANVTAGNLAEGVAKSAQNAKLAGFNIDQLSASIAVLKDTTGNTKSQIANSLNMIFSRLQNVKLGKFIIESEDGTEDITQAINDTEKLLNTFNIKLKGIGLSESIAKRLTYDDLAHLSGFPSVKPITPIINHSDNDTFVQHRLIMPNNNNNNSQPVSFNIGDININNPVSDSNDLAKELRLNLQNAFEKQMYTNLKW